MTTDDEVPQHPPPPIRRARLVLVTPSGELLGALPAYPVSTRWWPDAEPVVRGARENFGIDIVVLRLLATEPGLRWGGLVTYLAETRDRPATEPWDGTLDEHPLRQAWARPGGPDRDLAWADSVLAERGLTRIAPAEQFRSWNLSSLWRLPAAGQTVWLKHVPPFFGHEGAMLMLLAGGPVPRLIAHDGGRILMPAIPGEDQYDAKLPALEVMVRDLVELQATWAGRIDELLALGLPDWRAPALTELIADVIDRTATELTSDDQRTLRAFVRDLPRRFDHVAAAGLSDTLVHGDFHPGNVRGDSSGLVLLDWGDSGVGHALLDQPAFLERRAEDAATLRELWIRLWLDAVPGSDPAAAAALVAPIAAARQAVIYRKFLDNIEPSEHVYHAADPADWLARTSVILRNE
jgi:hypothetical protein